MRTSIVYMQTPYTYVRMQLRRQEINGERREKSASQDNYFFAAHNYRKKTSAIVKYVQSAFIYVLL